MNPPSYLEQLAQLVTTTWDGNLISKTVRDELVNSGLAQRGHGWNWLTSDGVKVLIQLGVLKS